MEHEYKIGDEVEVIDPMCHEYKMGEHLEVIGVSSTGSGHITCKDMEGNKRGGLYGYRVKPITPKPKFKVGEKVRVIGDSGVIGGGTPYSHGLYDRQIVKIEDSVDYHERGTYYNTKPHAGRTVREQDLELVTEETKYEHKNVSVSFTITKQKEETTMSETRRVVDVFIYDPDGDVEDKDAILCREMGLITNQTQEEFEHKIDLSVRLSDHNAKRAKLKDEFGNKLNPIRLGELKREFRVRS